VPEWTALPTKSMRRTLGETSASFHQRLTEGTYQAQPLRRIYIPKEDGKQRPISIPALEDKIVQKAVVENTQRHL
jgi:retron-type reverse transcriptase